MSHVDRPLENIFRLAIVLVIATTVANAQELSGCRTCERAEFGAAPIGFLRDRLAVQNGPQDRENISSFKTRLIRERMLDERSFRIPGSNHEPQQMRTRREDLENLPALSGNVPASEHQSAPHATPLDNALKQQPRTLVEPVRKPAPIRSVHDNIERRYRDPRTIRLLNQLTKQSAQSLFVEVAQLIDARHIQPTSYSQRIDNALNHLMLALDTSAFHQATRLQADERDVEQLQDALAQMRQDLDVDDLPDAVSVLYRTQQLFGQAVRVQPGTVGLEFVHAELDTLDQFSMLIPPEKAGGPSMGMRESVVGIGIEVETHDLGMRVTKVLSGGPAADVSLKRGDIITAVDRQSVSGLELSQAIDYIPGPPGTPLKLTLLREGRHGAVTLVRRQITIHSVAARMEDHTNKVGYIQLEQFSDASVGELEEALMSLHSQGMASLILDLRGNPGGLLTAAISISDLFLPSGTIVSTKGRTTSDNTKEAAHYEHTWRMPLVVLIDRNSASASEILAAAIQENGRGIIVGERSYGKGTVQTLFPLQSAAAGLRLTTAKFYSPEGREMSGEGVTPDVKVHTLIGSDSDDDTALAKALRLSIDPKVIEMARRPVRSGEAPRVLRIMI